MQLIDIRLTKLEAGGLRGTDAQLAELAESIRSVGLIHPIALNTKHEIIAGRRRVHAARHLELSHIKAVVCETFDDRRKALLAEKDENTCRVGLKPSEIKELADRIRGGPDGEKAKAKERQRGAGGSKNEKTMQKSASPNLGEALPGEANKAAASAAGVSPETLRKIDAIHAAAEAEPERFGDLRDKMDDEGKVDGAFKEMQKRAEEDAKKAPPDPDTDPLADAASDYCKTINQYTRGIDSQLSDFEGLRGNPLGHDIHWPTISSQLTAVRKALHQGRPKRKCPYCKATGRKGNGNCSPCKGTGYVCESIYKAGCAAVGVPAEKGDDE